MGLGDTPTVGTSGSTPTLDDKQIDVERRVGLIFDIVDSGRHADTIQIDFLTRQLENNDLVPEGSKSQERAFVFDEQFPQFRSAFMQDAIAVSDLAALALALLEPPPVQATDLLLRKLDKDLREFCPTEPRSTVLALERIAPVLASDVVARYLGGILDELEGRSMPCTKWEKYFETAVEIGEIFQQLGTLSPDAQRQARRLLAHAASLDRDRTNRDILHLFAELGIYGK